MTDIKYGWVDRKGNFIETGYYGHAGYANEIGVSENELELRGWVKICASSIGEDIAVWYYKELSKEQVKYIESLGFYMENNFGSGKNGYIVSQKELEELK